MGIYHPLKEIQGYTLQARDGEIGKVEDFYFDDHDWRVRYFVVDAGSWLDGRRVLISTSVLGEPHEKTIPVQLTRQQVKDSPGIDANKPVSRQYEESLVGYYGWPAWWTSGMGPMTAVGQPAYPAVPIPATGGTANASGLETGDEDEGMEDAPRSDQRRDPHLRSYKEVSGYRLNADDGEIGRVSDFIVDHEKWNMLYMVVDTGGLFGGKQVLLAPSWVQTISWADKHFDIDLSVETIRSSPEYDSSRPFLRDDEERINRHYQRRDTWQ